MLTHAVLILVILSPGGIVLDYEPYEDIHHCQSVSEYINEYDSGVVTNKVVACTCINFENVEQPAKCLKTNGEKNDKD